MLLPLLVFCEVFLEVFLVKVFLAFLVFLALDFFMKPRATISVSMAEILSITSCLSKSLRNLLALFLALM